MVKKVYIIPAAAAAALLVLILLIFSDTGSGSTSQSIYIAEGSGTRQLHENLSSNNITDSQALFKIAYYINWFIYGPVKPGLYDIKPPVTYYRLAKKFCSGDVAAITFPEGLTQAETADLIEKKLGMQGSPYLTALKKGKPAYEGMLFPATYRITSRDPEKLVKKMLETFQNRTLKLKPGKNDIILASIIQKEGAMIKEFKRISGVFHNRLNKNMKLESCPTLEFIVGKQRLTKEILKNPTPYNTYLYAGLPPGAICSPGLDAIEAARSPEIHDFYYFVSMKDGRNYFTRTIKEHFRAVGFYQFGYNNGFKPESGQYFQ